MACFVLYPLARGVYISFFKWNGYSQNMTFIGLKNYLNLFADKYFKSSFWNTMLYGFGSALLQNVFGLALALFLNSKFKIRNAVRTIIYLPVMISGLLMGYIMYFSMRSSNISVKTRSIGWQTERAARSSLHWSTAGSTSASR